MQAASQAKAGNMPHPSREIEVHPCWELGEVEIVFDKFVRVCLNVADAKSLLDKLYVAVDYHATMDKDLDCYFDRQFTGSSCAVLGPAADAVSHYLPASRSDGIQRKPDRFSAISQAHKASGT